MAWTPGDGFVTGARQYVQYSRRARFAPSPQRLAIQAMAIAEIGS
jgi:hypothetical protein